MEEWIIIEGSTEYGPCVSKFTGTKDEVKRLLMAMVDDAAMTKTEMPTILNTEPKALTR